MRRGSIENVVSYVRRHFRWRRYLGLRRWHRQHALGCGSCRVILPTPGSTLFLRWSCFSWASARQGKPLPKFRLVSLAVARLIRLAAAAILLRDRAGLGVAHCSL